MRVFVWGLVMSVSILGATAVATEGSIDPLRLRIVQVSRPGIVDVQIRNASNGPIRIWKESSSWGAAHWRVLLLREGQLSTFFQNPDQGFTKNNPDFDEIAAGSHMERKLNLNAGNWRGLSTGKFEFEKDDTVIVIYDVPKVFAWPTDPPSIEIRDMHIWYGVAAAFTAVP